MAKAKGGAGPGGAAGPGKAPTGAKKGKSAFDRPPEGKIRRSQVITTYGPGAMVDLVDDAVLIWGLDAWRFDQRVEVIEEQRLRERIAPRMKALGVNLAQEGYFRMPPDGNDQQARWSRAVKATVFPLWMVCQSPSCRRLLRSDQLSRKGDRYVHDCGKPAQVCVPVRFVAACPSGHLDEFPWVWFAHRGERDQTQCAAPALELHEGHTGDFSGVEVRCACGARRRLVDAKVEEKLMPRCSGKRPWLGRLGREPECEHRAGLMVRTASNGYFSVTESALSIPEEGSRLHDAVNDQWSVLKSATVMTLPAFRTIDAVRDALREWSDGAVLEVVAQIKAGQKPPREELRRAEFKRFTDAPGLRPGDLPAPTAAQFFARRVEELEVPLPAGVVGVTLAYKLREVRVQLGLTRFSPLPRDLKGETGETDGKVRLAPIGLGTDWLPAVEILGEGIFVQLDEAAVRAWERRPEVLAWEGELAAGHAAWARGRGQTGMEFPGARFFLLHSLAHLLITQLSLECGYAASAIRERIYCDAKSVDRPMAAILLSTGTPGTEGTLGGLVEQGSRMGYHLRQAVDLGALCSNDPVCAQHSPKGDLSERHFDGAACYACLFIAESSCEWFNRHLDRSLVVPAVGQPVQRAFFGPEAFAAARGPARGAWGGAPVGGGPAGDGPAGGAEAAPAIGTTTAAGGTLDGAWAEVLADCELEGAAALLEALARAGAPVPGVGVEVAGVLTELSWASARLAVVGPRADAAALAAAGWRVLVAPVAPGGVLAALEEGR